MSAPMAPTHDCRLLRYLAPLGFCVLTVCGLAGCEDPEIKKYSASRDEAVADFTRLADYKVPDGWMRVTKVKETAKDKDPTKLALATFEIHKADKTVQVTISRLPGSAGGLDFNISRWRGQVGFPKPADEKEFEKEMKDIQVIKKGMVTLQVDGKKADYVDLSHPEKKDAGRILGVVINCGSVTWFFKMHGPTELVEQEKEAFKRFVESVKFGGTGANDG
jgi:hypothetical protein